MPKFKVTIRQQILQHKIITVEADSREEAEWAAGSAEYIDDGEFEFVTITDYGVDEVQPIKESEDE